MNTFSWEGKCSRVLNMPDNPQKQHFYLLTGKHHFLPWISIKSRENRHPKVGAWPLESCSLKSLDEDTNPKRIWLPSFRECNGWSVQHVTLKSHHEPNKLAEVLSLPALVMGHNSLSRELLAGSQKGEYSSACSRGLGPIVFCICPVPTVQVFFDVWVGDFCLGVFLMGFFFCGGGLFYYYYYFYSCECWLHCHKPLRLELPDSIQYLSYFFFSPLQIHPLLPDRPRAILKLPCHIHSGVRYFPFTFQEREGEQVRHFLVQANLQLLDVSTFKNQLLSFLSSLKDSCAFEPVINLRSLLWWEQGWVNSVLTSLCWLWVPELPFQC